MARLACPPSEFGERYTERFEAHDIEVDNESESMRDESRSLSRQENKSETASWVHVT